MTGPSEKALESQLRLAAASRPGSLESRHVYGCTCVPDERTSNRAIGWSPQAVVAGGWVPTIDLECPAHGRLLEEFVSQRVRDEAAAVDAAVRRMAASGMGECEFAVKSLRPKPRTKLERLRDAAWSAYYGFLEGWRGPW